MEGDTVMPRVRRSWVDFAVAGAFLVVGLGVVVARSVVGRGADFGAVISDRGDARGRPVYVSLSGVTNHSEVPSEALTVAAREAIVAALASRAEVTTTALSAAQRGARAGGARGHFLDANIQGVQVTAASARVSVSIVVSSSPSRAYEFESTATVTLSGRDAVTPAGQADAVRRAMQRATRGAVDQIVRGAP
jgi:hypothetical protein